MAYDLLIKHGRVIDGSGMPSLRDDIGVQGGKIVDIGKLRGSAARTIDADGLVVAPGFVDNHCHYAESGRLAESPLPQRPYSRSLYFKSPTQRR